MKKFLLFLIALPLFAQETPAPAGPWSSSIGAGLAITSGNSDTTNVNVSASRRARSGSARCSTCAIRSRPSTISCRRGDLAREQGHAEAHRIVEG